MVIRDGKILWVGPDGIVTFLATSFADRERLRDAVGNYGPKLHDMMASGQIAAKPGPQGVLVYHDDSCGVFSGRLCDCDPDIEVGAGT